MPPESDKVCIVHSPPSSGKDSQKLRMVCSRDFQPFSSHGTHKLIITKILRHTKNRIIVFANLTKIGIILIYSQQMANVGLAIVFCFDF